jgi:hypothetical protein
MNKGSAVGVAVGTGVSVDGMGVLVSGIGVSVGGSGVSVGATGVEAGAHPLNKTVRNINTRKTNPIDFFMTLSPFDLIVRQNCQTYDTRPSSRFGHDHVTIV